MNFFKLFLRSIALLPSLAQGVEGLYGAKTGAQKKAAAMEVVSSALRLPEAITNKTVVDPDGFTQGLSKVIDGVIQCMNSSIWAGQSAAPPQPQPAEDIHGIAG